MYINGLVLVQTSSGCPEQYEVLCDTDGNVKQVGYLRLRHGSFYAAYPDHKGEIVYTASPKGDGSFSSEEERYFYLREAVKALTRKHKEVTE